MSSLGTGTCVLIFNHHSVQSIAGNYHLLNKIAPNVEFFFKDFFFLMWTIFKVFIEFATMLLLFYILVLWLWGMWDLSSPTRDRTRTPCIGRRSLNHWTAREVPKCGNLKIKWLTTSEDIILKWNLHLGLLCILKT